MLDSAWVVTGMSGAGKATALALLERAGFRCIDNLPLPLLGEVVSPEPTAVVVDARQGQLVAHAVPPAGWRVLFLDAADEVLVRRLADSTRPHPCAAAGGGEASVRAERTLLQGLRAAADVVIDTSALSPAVLRERLVTEVVPADHSPDGTAVFLCTVSSFGFKYGPQTEADWVVDARFLANPFWEPELRPMTGLDAPVRDFVLARPVSRELVDRLADTLSWTMTQAREHGRARLHVAIGCTGGRHRSVVVACALAERLEAAGWPVVLRHRDVGRPDPR